MRMYRQLKKVQLTKFLAVCAQVTIAMSMKLAVSIGLNRVVGKFPSTQMNGENVLIYVTHFEVSVSLSSSSLPLSFRLSLSLSLSRTLGLGLYLSLCLYHPS
jgi:hypothetical protein